MHLSCNKIYSVPLAVRWQLELIWSYRCESDESWSKWTYVLMIWFRHRKSYWTYESERESLSYVSLVLMMNCVHGLQPWCMRMCIKMWLNMHIWMNQLWPRACAWVMAHADHWPYLVMLLFRNFVIMIMMNQRSNIVAMLALLGLQWFIPDFL